MQCKFHVTSYKECPTEATWEARKNGKPYAVYCDQHIESLAFLWLRYGIRILYRPLVEEVA